MLLIILGISLLIVGGIDVVFGDNARGQWATTVGGVFTVVSFLA